jgi:transposase-like protein
VAAKAKPSTKTADVTLVDLFEDFGGDEDTCREYLEALRWPDGVTCPRCDHASVSRIEARNQYDCNSCRYQFSVKAGTVLNDSHLPLWKWFLAVYLMCESKKGISANQIKRTLKVSYKTAWYLCHRIRHAMGDPLPELLDGTVEVDETFIGGHVSGGSKKARFSNKTIVAGAVQRDGGELRMRVIESRDGKALGDFIRDHVAADAQVYTDDLPAYKVSGIAQHSSVNHSKDEWVRGRVHTNTIESAWSLLDRGIMGSFHKINRKHLPAYLQEFEFRYNNRENTYIFRDTLMALLDGECLPYEKLTS